MILTRIAPQKIDAIAAKDDPPVSTVTPRHEIIIALTAIDMVYPPCARHPIIARTAINPIIACMMRRIYAILIRIADKRVIAQPAMDNVIALTAINGLITTHAIKHVVTPKTIKIIGISAADKNVITTCAGLYINPMINITDCLGSALTLRDATSSIYMISLSAPLPPVQKSLQPGPMECAPSSSSYFRGKPGKGPSARASKVLT